MNRTQKCSLLAGYTLLTIVISALITTLVIKNFYTLQTKVMASENEISEIQSQLLKSTPIKDKDRLIEVISYACHYCENAETNIQALEKELPQGMKVTRIHLVAANGLGIYAPVFATLQAMGLEKQIRSLAYQAVIEKQIDLTDAKQREQWLTANKIDINEYNRVSQSSEAAQVLNYMRSISEHYNIQATPAFIVDKKWVVYQNTNDKQFNKDILALLTRSGDKDG